VRAGLSDAAGARYCRAGCRQRIRHIRPSNWSISIGASRSAIRHREPAGRGRKHRHRSGRAFAAGRLYASTGERIERHQRNTLHRLNFDFIRDIAPISRLATFSFVMVVNPSVPTKSLPEFNAFAKVNPGKINMASASSGSTSHVVGELFKMMAGVDMVHVPYRGSTPALTDLLAGQVQVMFDATPSSLPYITAGKLRPLAVTTTTRLEVLTDVPTVGDFVPGYEASSWLGFGAPKNTPAAVVDRLNKEINLALSHPPIKARLGDLGGVGPTSRPLSLQTFWSATPKSGRG
jgi:tripartite-type tricarboxylate transporter receptor subunit TctC